MKYFPLFIPVFIALSHPFHLSASGLEEGMVSPHLQKAWAFLEAERPHKALDCLSRGKTDPGQAPYYFFIRGRAWEKLSHPTQALADYRSAYFHAPSDTLKALALLERAEAYFRFKNFHEAKMVYSLFFSHFGMSAHLSRAHLGMANSLTALNILDKALGHYEQAGETAATFLGKAVVLHRLGRFQEAHDYFVKGTSLSKALFDQNPEFLFAFGENLLELGRDKEALDYLTSKRLDPVYKKKGELVMGRMALQAGNYLEAQKFFESALTSSDPSTKQQALYLLAETYVTTRKTAQARQALWEYWSKYPGGRHYESVLLMLAKIDLAAGREERSSRWLKELGTRSHLQEKTLLELEGLLLHLKDKDPRLMGSLWNIMGKRFLQVSREPFLLLMAKALKGSGESFVRLHQWLAQNGSEPVRMQSRVALIRQQIESGRLEEASRALSSLKTTKVPREEQLRLEAALLQARGDYRQVAKVLLSIKKVGPQDLSLLQESLALGGDIEQALPVIEKNINRLGGNSKIFSRLGDLYYTKGKAKEALNYYQKVLENDPLNEWALLRAGTLLKGEEARKLLGKIREENSLVGKFAKTGLRELELQKKMGDRL
ncbi:MAG: tetratricopeptide repeat protein [Thermodesulfobacteriota bacterium]